MSRRDPNRKTKVGEKVWKPPLNKSYELLTLTNSELNYKIRPAGFRPTGKMRQVKQTCLLSTIRTRCVMRGQFPKTAVCITMYNENEAELLATLSGVCHNYNSLRLDSRAKFTKDDMLVVVICDGYERIPESFKKMAREQEFLDEELLVAHGYMNKSVDETGKVNYSMRPIKEIMNPEVPEEEHPQNMLHLF